MRFGVVLSLHAVGVPLVFVVTQFIIRIVDSIAETADVVLFFLHGLYPTSHVEFLFGILEAALYVIGPWSDQVGL
jgi:hypothetical protein